MYAESKHSIREQNIVFFILNGPISSDSLRKFVFLLAQNKFNSTSTWNRRFFISIAHKMHQYYNSTWIETHNCCWRKFVDRQLDSHCFTLVCCSGVITRVARALIADKSFSNNHCRLSKVKLLLLLVCSFHTDPMSWPQFLTNQLVSV